MLRAKNEEVIGECYDCDEFITSDKYHICKNSNIQAEQISESLIKIEGADCFDFDKDYENSNVIDRSFLKSLVNKDDLNGK